MSFHAPKRRKHAKAGIRESSFIRCPGHLQFVRGHQCSVEGRNEPECGGSIQAAHVRTGTDGGISVKPSDCWAIPLCGIHHARQHQMGEASFEKHFAIDMKRIAAALWAKSPAGIKYRLTRDKESAE